MTTITIHKFTVCYELLDGKKRLATVWADSLATARGKVAADHSGNVVMFTDQRLEETIEASIDEAGKD